MLYYCIFNSKYEYRISTYYLLDGKSSLSSCWKKLDTLHQGNIYPRSEYFLWVENALKLFPTMIAKKYMINIKRKSLKKQNIIFK